MITFTLTFTNEIKKIINFMKLLLTFMNVLAMISPSHHFYVRGERFMNDKQLNKTLREVLENHKKWYITRGRKGERLDLSKADLREAYLCSANLGGADLSDADLYMADFKSSLITIDQLTECSPVSPDPNSILGYKFCMMIISAFGFIGDDGEIELVFTAEEGVPKRKLIEIIDELRERIIEEMRTLIDDKLLTI